ncbi:TRAP transporter small permease [Arthrobacter echini]|uniref:TRAP transporter small permease n=1 Tax=Arthrobacter echini TaxID=1529066 RepID=A0A4S5E5K2_9MICC|nr:TRAP transporter small permease [Arthrobacter echini]THJ66791.1 TRAP transporter small permease [Arthrobacter echini]
MTEESRLGGSNENNIAAGYTIPQEPDEPDFPEQRSRLYRFAINVERAATCALLVGTLGLIILQVVSRYVFSTPFSWTEELARFALIWFTFVSAGFVMARRIHIAVDLLASKLGRTGGIVLDTFALVVVAAVAGLMAFAGARFAAGADRLLAPATSLPMSVVYSAAVVGFGLIFLHALLHIYLNIRHPEVVPNAMDNLEREAV